MGTAVGSIDCCRQNCDEYPIADMYTSRHISMYITRHQPPTCLERSHHACTARWRTKNGNGTIPSADPPPLCTACPGHETSPFPAVSQHPLYHVFGKCYNWWWDGVKGIVHARNGVVGGCSDSCLPLIALTAVGFEPTPLRTGA